jgi:hypothetical protein
MATYFDLKSNERTRKVNGCMAKEIKPRGDKLLAKVKLGRAHNFPIMGNYF